MLKSVIRYVRGVLRFTVTGPYPERFLNLCARGGIGLWQSCREGDRFTASCALSHRKQIEYYAQKSGAELTVLRCSGIFPAARRYRRRTGLWIGAALFIFGILAMGRFVWQVELRGLETLPQQQVLAALEEYGVHPGRLASAIDAKTVERQMQVHFDKIAWIAVNIEGSRATVIIEEAVVPPTPVEDGIPTNVVAEFTGFITRLEVHDGSPVVAVGDSVHAGDLLISGIMDNAVGESRTVHARGRVWALTRESLSVTVPYDQVSYRFRGIARRRTLQIFGWQLPLQAAGIPREPYRLEQAQFRPEGLFAWLPISITTDCYLLQEEQHRTVTAEEALAIATAELAAKESLWQGAAVHSRELAGQEGPEGFTLTAEYLLEREIGAEQAFSSHSAAEDASHAIT